MSTLEFIEKVSNLRYEYVNFDAIGEIINEEFVSLENEYLEYAEKYPEGDKDIYQQLVATHAENILTTLIRDDDWSPNQLYLAMNYVNGWIELNFTTVKPWMNGDK